MDPTAERHGIKVEVIKDGLREVSLPANWDYSTFREYLLSLTRGRDFELPLNQFPGEIELSPDWHAVLNKMRTETSDDMTEKWAGICFRKQEGRLYLPNFPAQGKSHHVPAEVMMAELTKMKTKAGMDGIIGDIHTHPRKIPKNFWQDAMYLTNDGAFSVGDLFCLLTSNPNLVMGVTDGLENIFAFRSHDTSRKSIYDYFPTQELFEKYWYEKNGWKYIGGIEKNGDKRAQPTLTAKDSWSINKQIAEKHNLVLYKGNINGKLVKDSAS